MWYEISHLMALLIGAAAGTLFSIDFVLVWAGVYYFWKNDSKWLRHAMAIYIALIVHIMVIQLLNAHLNPI